MDYTIRYFMSRSVEIKSFRELYKNVYFGLSVNGFYPGQPVTKRLIVWRIINMTWQLSALCCLTYAAIKDIEMKDFIDATRQLSILTLATIMMLKCLNLTINREKMTSLVARVDAGYEDCRLNGTPEEQAMIIETIKYAQSIQNIWAVQVGFVGCVFSFSAFFIMAYLALSDKPFKKQMVFDTMYPFVDHLKFEPGYYELSIIYEFFINFFVTVLYIGYDPLIPIFTMYLVGQFEVQKHRISQVFQPDRSEKETNEMLSKIIKDLQELFDFVDDFDSSTKIVSQIIFATSPIQCTVSGFSIYSMLIAGEFPYEFFFFFGCTFFHMLMPSYFGDILQEKSLSVCDALYGSRWEQSPHQTSKKSILMMILRSQKACTLSTTFSTISMMLFCEATQTFWTLFNLLVVAFEIDMDVPDHSHEHEELLDVPELASIVS